MSVLERSPSYRESNKGNKQRQGPTLSVHFTEVSIKRESTVVVKVLGQGEGSGSLRKQLTFNDVTIGFPSKEV